MPYNNSCITLVMVRTNGTTFARRMMSAKQKEDTENTEWTVHEDGVDYVGGNYPGWTNTQASDAKKRAKVSGKRKSRGGCPKEQAKAILVTLVLDIPVNIRFKWSPAGKTRKEIEAQCDLVQEAVELGESLKREWRLVDSLPKGYYNMKKVWHHMGEFGAINRAQSVAILGVLKDLKKDLYVQLGQLDVAENELGLFEQPGYEGDPGNDDGAANGDGGAGIAI
jgi:hypothetical protein